MELFKLGLIARDIHNSVTPMVYEGFAKDLGIAVNYSILNVEPEKLEETVRFARENWNGFTVTMPYKQSVLRYIDVMDETVEGCGSANTVLVKNGKLSAYNTDGWGMIKAFSLAGVEVIGKKVVMVGAGGVGLSIAYNLKVNGARDVHVLNVDLPQAQRLVQRFGAPFTCALLTENALSEACEDADIFINASVLGQVGYDEYASFGFLRRLKPEALVFDVNYSNPDAHLVPAAKEAGLRAFVGSAMSICQGIKAMEYWTGRTPTDPCTVAIIERWYSENRSGEKFPLRK